MVLFVNIIFMMAALYLLAGVLFAVFFLSKGVEKMDTGAHGAGWGFRLMILPGTIVLWPVLLSKWRKVKKISNDETAS
jgi:TM2 domain-containing membrane protein YozV